MARYYVERLRLKNRCEKTNKKRKREREEEFDFRPPPTHEATARVVVGPFLVVIIVDIIFLDCCSAGAESVTDSSVEGG